MSAEDSSQEDKQLAPSEQRLTKAREEGQVVRSRELTTFLLLGGAVLYFVVAAPTMWNAAMQLMGAGLSFDARMLASPDLMAARLGNLAAQGFVVAGPMIALLMVVGIGASLALGGWNFTWTPIMPKLSRIDPLSGIRRIISKQGFAEMGKLLIAVLVLVCVSAWLIWSARESAAALSGMGANQAVATLGELLLFTLSALVGVLALVALGDVPLQIWRHESELKMTLVEAKKEAKESDGNPQIKAKIRQQQRAIAQRRMMQHVPTADVIVTNPSHYAVALKYDENGFGAPRVVAKGMDLIAQRIREIGGENKVPILEAPPLARALYRHAELDQEVPVALYQAVAQVLAYVFQLRRHHQGLMSRPDAPESIEIPSGMDPHEVSL